MILHGDCRQQLATLPDCSVDAIVTDPPYELGFMGKRWDASGIAYDGEVWSQCLRVLKPGGHLCAFGGTRTYHRMTVAIEDAGFEIRDSLHWIYGSGFPKSLDVSKAIDKRGGTVAGFESFRDAVKDAMVKNGVTRSTLHAALGNHMLSHYLTAGSQPAVPNLRDYRIIRDTVGLGDEFDHLFADEAERELLGMSAHKPGIANGTKGHTTVGGTFAAHVPITAPATDAAARWEGWGTALKPAHEPIVLARKPLSGTVAANVMEYGTGALNIDATRVANMGAPIPRITGTATLGGVSDGYDRPWKHDPEAVAARQERADAAVDKANKVGRWPANIILTHSPECETECVPSCPVATLNEQSGTTTGVQRTGFPGGRTFGGGEMKASTGQWFGDSGGASRFFTTTTWDPELDAPFLYVAKPSRKERNAGLDGMPEGPRVHMGSGGRTLKDGQWVETHSEPQPRDNFHPTVKPVALMRHLVRLVTPPGGTVLDPFLGSGTTAVAATLEGFDWIGCELTDDYLPIIQARVAWAEQHQPEPDLTLFTDAQ